MHNKVRAIMAAVLETDESSITPTAGPDNFEKWTSIRHMHLVLALEETFGIQFDDDEVPALVSYQAITQAITKKIA